MSWLVVHPVEGVPIVSVGRAGDGYIVRVHHVADFAIAANGDVLGRTPEPEVSDASVDEAFTLQVLPALYQLRGRPALHASAVEVDAGFVAFMGPTGAGKSTLAALLSSRYPLVSDDCLPLEPEGDRFMVTPSSRQVRLRNEAAPRFGIEPDEWAKPALALAFASERRPLLRMYAIDQPGEAVCITPLPQKEAMMQVAALLHRLDPESPHLLRAELEYLERLTRSVPVARLQYPRNFEGVDAIARAISDDLRRTA